MKKDNCVSECFWQENFYNKFPTAARWRLRTGVLPFCDQRYKQLLEARSSII